MCHIIRAALLSMSMDSQFRAAHFFNLLDEQSYGLTALIGFQSGNVQQPIPVLAKVFKALQSVEADCPALRK